MKTSPPFLASSLVTLLAVSAARGAIDFEKEIRPILETNCVRCHNPKGTDFEENKTDLDLSTHATATESKSTIVEGDATKSRLYTTTVLPDDAKKLMPPRNKVTNALDRLTTAETLILKAWIDEGAKWPEKAKLIARKKEAAGAGGDKEPQLVADIAKRIAETSREKTAAEMKAYSTLIPGSEISFDMVPIPGGKFKIGSPEAEPGHKPDESPQTEVTLSPFWMGKCEVTWNEFHLFMYPDEEKKIRETKKLPALLNTLTDATAHPTQPYVEMSFGMGTDGFPAISMTQHAANKYCQWLSAKTGHFYRLPTEAEWEYAARAGTTTAYFWGDSADPQTIGEYCWWGKNADFKYQKVGKKKPNPWGLCDILGNVTEWCLDAYDPNAYANMAPVNPWLRATKPYPHVARGGSWDDEEPALLRCAARRASSAEWKRQDPQLPKSIWYHTDAQFLGFRLVRPLELPPVEVMQSVWNNGVEKDNPDLIKAE